MQGLLLNAINYSLEYAITHTFLDNSKSYCRKCNHWRSHSKGFFFFHAFARYLKKEIHLCSVTIDPFLFCQIFQKYFSLQSYSWNTARLYAEKIYYYQSGVFISVYFRILGWNWSGWRNIYGFLQRHLIASITSYFSTNLITMVFLTP